MKRTVFEIILIVLGIIMGSIANVHGTVRPFEVSIRSNEDAKILLKQGGTTMSEMDMGSVQLLPVHYEDGKFYRSSTLSMDNLDGNGDGCFYQQIYDMTLDKQIDNAYLQVEFTVDGEDAINNALRLKVKYKTEEFVVAPGESVLIDTAKLSSTATTTVVTTVWYELSDPNCTIDNMNSAQGSQYNINFYAYVKES